MPALDSIKVNDQNLCEDLEKITCAIEDDIFPDNYKKSMHLNAEFNVSLECLTSQVSPRNLVSLYYTSEFIVSANKTRSLEFDGPANIVY